VVVWDPKQLTADSPSVQSFQIWIKHYRFHLQGQVRDRNIFKILKQHLKVKTFIGTSENALRIQIRTASIVLFPLEYLHHLPGFGWSMSTILLNASAESLYLQGSSGLVT